MVNVPCSRKRFLTLGLCTLATGLIGCSGEDPAPAPGGGGSTGTGGKGAGGSGGASGGSTSTGGSTATGGSSGSGGASGGTGGASGGTGGASGGTGGASGGTGGASGGTGGSGGGGADACGEDIVALCSPSDGAVDGHTHVLTIPIADIMAGVTKTFQTDDNTGHCHQVELTDADFTTLKSGGVVTKPTCNGGNHEFVISCGANPPAPVNPATCPGGDNEGGCN